ncbi:hypothetical protein Tco_1197851 [Tanacetum coccineum]
MVAFLSKPTESEGFEQIVDFLNAHPINSVASPSRWEDDYVTKASIRSDLQLDDADDEAVNEENVSNFPMIPLRYHGCHMDSTHFDTNLDMFGVHDLDGDEVFVETEEHVVNAAKTTTQALAELKNIKPKAVTIAATITTTAVTRPKAKGLVIQEQEQASTPITSSKDNGKGIMVEEPLKMKKKDQVETGYELAQRLQAEEQEELTIEENSKLFQQLLEKRRMHFAAKRAEE